jgi:hypothetical protein
MVLAQREADARVTAANLTAQRDAERAEAVAQLRLLRARHVHLLKLAPEVAAEFDHLLADVGPLSPQHLLEAAKGELAQLASLLDKLGLLAQAGVAEAELTALRPQGLFQVSNASAALEPLLRRLPARGMGRFVKMGPDGDMLPAHAEAWVAVLDSHTQLMWEVKTEQGLHSRHARYANIGQDQEGDTGRLLREVNAARLAGHADWRLPSVEELGELAATRSAGGLDFRIAGEDFAWSATPAADGYAWFVSLADGSRFNFDLRSMKCAVHLVRGPV